MKTFNLETVDNIALVKIDLVGEKVNKLTSEVMLQLEQLILDLSNSKSEAVVFISKKPGFIAGADISEIQKLETVGEAMGLSSSGQRIFEMLEDLDIPSVAAINGACLGGGLEFALACDYRIATKTSNLGLPETKLGVIPGLGGTIRLPKLVGLSAGLKMILTGKSVDGKKALKMGLIDELVPEEILESHTLKMAKTIAKREFVFDWKSRLRLVLKPIIIHLAKRKVLAKTMGHYPAPIKALEVIGKTYGSFNKKKALDIEAAVFSRLAIGNISKNLTNIFFGTQRAKKALSVDAKSKQVDSLAVLGAGVMGGGIASLAASKGIESRMKDINLQALLTGFRAASGVWKRQGKYEYQANMDRLSGRLDFAGFKHVDMVIEAVVEDIKIKKQVLSELVKHCSSDVVIATNTSSLSVSEMCSSLDIGYQKNFVGMHFFNPVNKMPLVEVVKGKESSDEVLVTVFDLAKRMGKIPVVVKDSPGFLVNRLLLPYLNEALYLLADGFSIRRIDAEFVNFGLPMGPLRLLDEVGLDVACKVADVFYQAFGDRAKPSELMQKLVSLGRLGRKTGSGFYVYDAKGGVRLDDSIYGQLGLEIKGSKGFDGEEITNRGICVMINEAALALDEKVVGSQWELDLAMVMGIGFPAFTGGLMKYAHTKGFDQIADFLDHWYEKTKSERFKCAGFSDIKK